MTIFDNQRLTNATLKLDIEGLRRGDYSDKYFENIVRVLEAAHSNSYTFGGQSPRDLPVDPSSTPIGNLEVEAQVFVRHAPTTLVAGVDVTLAMLRHAAGSVDAGEFVERWRQLEVEAVADGVFADYDGDPMQVMPVLKIRGRYRDFALLETPILGVLSRASRIATNVYNVLEVANGKPVLYFPARFDVPEVQAIDGYAYWLAIQRYNYDAGQSMTASVSTDAQAAWWRGSGSGTVPHALIATFLGDTAEAMLTYARYLPPDVLRIALVDFDNDCVAASLATLNAFWERYQSAWQAGDADGQRRWTLHGVRLDTGSKMRDVSLEPDGATGVNPELVRLVRSCLDDAWQNWSLTDDLTQVAQRYCQDVRIVVTGGFNRDKVAQFERDGVPANIYGVGSTFLTNDSATNTDYTMDIVRVKLDGHWVGMAKVGRQACANPDLQQVDLSKLD